MNNDDSVNDVEPEATSNAPPTDTSGKPVNVDQTNTPSSTRTKELEAEELSRKIAENAKWQTVISGTPRAVRLQS